MNTKIILLAVGILAGALVAWLTLPEVASVSVGELRVEVKTGDGWASDPAARIAVFSIIGAAVGLAVGFLVERLGGRA